MVCSAADHDVGERCVAHDNAALGSGLTIDVVDAHTGTADDLELGSGFDDLAGDRRGRTHDERIVLGNHLDEFLGRGIGLERDFVAGILEHGDTSFVELLRNQYLHDYPHSLVAIMRRRSKCSYCSNPSSRAIRAFLFYFDKRHGNCIFTSIWQFYLIKHRQTLLILPPYRLF